MNSPDHIAHRIAEELYQKLGNEEDARACEDIPESGCHVVPGNFFLILGSQCLTKLGDAIVNPKTVLTWVAVMAGAPGFVLSLLVPVRESGSMMPQLFIGGMVRHLPVRKWVWVAGSVVQAATVIGMGLAVWYQFHVGIAILLLLIVFSLGRGLCSVASKDVLGKTIPKGNRGKLNGWSVSLAGVITLVIGGALVSYNASEFSHETLASLLLFAGLLWLLAALVYSRVMEVPGETDGALNAVEVALSSLRLLHEDHAFRWFVITRALLMCSALSAPFFLAMSQAVHGTAPVQLGLFMLAGGLASLLSAPLWGMFADQSSKAVLNLAAVCTAIVCLVVYLSGEFAPAVISSSWGLPLAYFLLQIAHSGVRVGRKTYVLDLASGNKRTAYVSVGNTLIGILLLLAGSLGLLTPVLGARGMVGLFGLMGLAGALMCRKLKAV